MTVRGIAGALLHRGRWGLYPAALSLLAIAPGAGEPALGAASITIESRSAASVDGISRPASHKAARKRRTRVVTQPRIVPSAAPQFAAIGYPYQARVGQHLIVTVRLYGGAGAARSTAFHVSIDPAVVRYAGALPTGGGALLVEPSSHEGEIVVYRSSVPEGFLPTETLVDLEFEAVGPGITSILITDARLFDGAARELKSTSESGSLEIE